LADAPRFHRVQCPLGPDADPGRLPVARTLQRAQRPAALAGYSPAGRAVLRAARATQADRTGHFRDAAHRVPGSPRAGRTSGARPPGAGAGLSRSTATGHRRAGAGHARLERPYGPGFPVAGRGRRGTRSWRQLIMLDIHMTFEDGQQRTIRAPLPLVIGRAPQCGLRIANWRVAKRHARLDCQGQALELEDLGSLGGTFVNGGRITVHRPVLPGDDVLIGPCRLRVRMLADAESREAGRGEEPAGPATPDTSL